MSDTPKMSKHRWDSVGAILGRLTRDKKLQTTLHQARVFKAFSDLLGEAARRHAKPERLYKTELTVAVDSAAWRQQLQFLMDDLRKQINGVFGREVLTSIRLTHGHKPKYEAPEVAPPKPVDIPVTPQDHAKAAELSHLVEDRELSSMMAHLYLRAKQTGRVDE